MQLHSSQTTEQCNYNFYMQWETKNFYDSFYFSDLERNLQYPLSMPTGIPLQFLSVLEVTSSSITSSVQGSGYFFSLSHTKENRVLFKWRRDSDPYRKAPGLHHAVASVQYIWPKQCLVSNSNKTICLNFKLQGCLDTIIFQSNIFLLASLVAQWLRIHLPMQVWSLVWEDPTYLGATKPKHHNYWACALEPESPQLLKPTGPKAHAPQQEKPVHRN